jgi:hypothetical protein
VRKGHFVWINDRSDGGPAEFQPYWFWSVYTFMLHHPGWEIKLWTNCQFTDNFYKFLTAKGMKTVTVVTTQLGTKLTRAWKADYIKYTAILEGGVCCDLTDTMSLRCMEPLVAKLPGLVYGRYRNSADEDGFFGAGWTGCAQPNHPAIVALLRHGGEAEPFMHAKSQEAQYTLTPLPTDVFYPLPMSTQFKTQPAKAYVTERTHQIHWYFTSNFDNPMSKARRQLLLSNSRLDNPEQGEYWECLQLALQNAGTTWAAVVKEFTQLCGSPLGVIPPTPAELLQHSLCINLTHRHDRRNEFLQQLQPLGFNPKQLFPAFPSQRYGRTGFGCGPGATGCSLSHSAVLKFAKLQGWPQVLVWEDDVVLAPDFLSKLTAVLPQLPGDWETVFLGSYQRINYKPLNEVLGTTDKTVGAHCVLVRASAYDRLIAELDAVEHVTDTIYSTAVRSYTCYPSLAGQRDGHSDITQGHRTLSAQAHK